MSDAGPRAVVDVLCVGELLWDSLPAGLFLGGAPFNVAAHLHALGTAASILSRVGRDRLGEEAVRRVAHQGMTSELIQVDDELPTGFVSVALDPAGAPSFDIVAPSAWDAIRLTDRAIEIASGAKAIVLGSLAQRSDLSRATITRLADSAALRVFDVNLRPPFDDRDIVRETLARADVVKLNEHELQRLGGWYSLPHDPLQATQTLAERFGCDTICITRGSEGASLFREGRWSHHPGYPVEVADTVGAGDAFLAAFLSGLLNGEDDRVLLERANLLGAFVASRPGALPPRDTTALEDIRTRGVIRHGAVERAD